MHTWNKPVQTGHQDSVTGFRFLSVCLSVYLPSLDFQVREIKNIASHNQNNGA